MSYEGVVIYVPINAGPDQAVDEGSIISFSATVENYDANLLAYDWDLDNDGVFDTAGMNTSFAAVDGPGTYIVTARGTAPAGPSSTDSAIVTINNVEPTVDPIIAPVDPVLVSTPVAVRANFIDPGTLDTHTAVWDWGDGTISPATVTETAGSGSVGDTHIYTTPGVYTVGLTITDNDGGVGKSTHQFVVVYDPTGGFVTGGGWINSPVGAYAADPELDRQGQLRLRFQVSEGCEYPDREHRIPVQGRRPELQEHQL